MDNEALMSERETLIEVARMAVQLYAETHPRPTQVTQQQAAEMLGVSSKTVQRYLRSGKLRLNRCGYLSVSSLDALLSPQ
jgi:excisionase family DNA binding protein